MSGPRPSIHSPLWHRAEGLRPKLRADAVAERHVIRGVVWYVMRDRFSTRAHRFSPAVYAVLMRMDGVRTLDRIWREVVDRFGEDAPSQDQILRSASQLYAAGLLQSDAVVDQGDLSERGRKAGDRVWSANLKNPMFVRVPLFDPNRFLNATVHLVRPFCGPLGGALWLAAVIWLGAQMALRWDELTNDISDRVLAAESILTIILVYPALKILHEFGHAYATKLLGEDVHEMGVMFLTLLPAPYVDASASAMAPGKWRRALVAAAGMMVELAVAALAMLVWIEAQPGLLRSIAYDALLIATVSTLVFNGNPLLRFDAYYILCDLIEIPNLGTRSQRYYLYLLQRWLFGARGANNPAMAPGERFWFLVYAPASLVYRMTTLFGIAVFVSTQYFVVGAGLAAWMAVSSILLPLLKGLRYVFVSSDLEGVRLRAGAITVVGVAALVGGVAFAPIPDGTVTRGFVWIPDESRVVSQASGRIAEWLTAAGSTVMKDAPLMRLEDPFIDAKRKRAQARLGEIEARLFSAQVRSPFEGQVLERQRDLAQAELRDLERQQRDLVVRSPGEGLFVAPNAPDLAGNFIRRGQTVGYVMAARAPAIRATVPEADIELVRDRTRAVAVRFDEEPWTPFEFASIERQTPKATRKLPSPALASANGGPFATDPGAKERDQTIESFFEIDVVSPRDFPQARWGQRVWVRFDHGASPLALRLWRIGRQLFLKRYYV